MTTRAFDAATAELVSRLTEKIGPKRKDPYAPAAPKPMSAALKVQIAKTKATALAKAETEYKRRCQRRSLRKTARTQPPNGRPPGARRRTNTSSRSRRPPDRTFPTIRRADGGPVQTPPPAAAKTAAPAAGKPKTAKLSDVRAYAKKNGISEADALKKAKSEGFAITGAVMPQSFTDFMAAPSASPAQSFGEFMAAPAPVAAPAPEAVCRTRHTVLRETDINAHALAGTFYAAQHASAEQAAPPPPPVPPLPWGLRTPRRIPRSSRRLRTSPRCLGGMSPWQAGLEAAAGASILPASSRERSESAGAGLFSDGARANRAGRYPGRTESGVRRPDGRSANRHDRRGGRRSREDGRIHRCGMLTQGGRAKGPRQDGDARRVGRVCRQPRGNYFRRRDA